jgi:outer membrane protein with beta-barrel domain
MQSKAVFLLSTACIFASAGAADAQIVFDASSAPSRFSIGVDFAISQPKGEFATAGIPTGYGFDVTGLYRIDPQGWFAIRADGGGVQYGHENIRLGFITGRVPISLNTDNRFGFGSLGIQLQFPDGFIRPYASASYAPVYFYTQSCVSADDNSFEDQCNTNHGDWTSAGVFGGGFTIPFGKSLGGLNLGARYHYGGRATYLKKGDITDNPDGTVTLNLHESKTDLVLWQIGVTFAIPRSTGH